MKFKAEMIILFMFLMLISQTFIFSAQNEDAVIVYGEIEKNDFIELRGDGNYYILQGEGHDEFNINLTFVNRSDKEIEFENVNYYIFNQDPDDRSIRDYIYPCDEGSLGVQILSKKGEKGAEKQELIHLKCDLKIGENKLWIQVGKEYWSGKVTKIDNLQKEVLQKGVERYPITIYYYTSKESYIKSEGLTIEDIRTNKNIIFPILIISLIFLEYILQGFIKKNSAVIGICVTIIGILVRIWWKL